MRPALAVSVLALAACAVACGLDVVGTGAALDGANVSPGDEGGAADARGQSPGDGVFLDGGSGLGDANVDDAAGEAAAPLVVASHVPAGVTFDPSAPPVSGVTQIDTTNHTITIGAGAPGLPAGVTFADHAGVAVLLTGALTIDVSCSVTGAAPLIVLADGPVTVSAKLDASAKLDVPGAGGAAPVTGSGHGTSGVDVGTDSPGGGGGGFGTPGARGGNASSSAKGGAAGGAYGPNLPDFNGGSGGGNGSPYGGCGIKGRGGAGGGALQISSAVSITIAASGTIASNGGGGHGGCDNGGSSTMSGGGGGSGGEIFLEAKVITMAGALVANGGGGGGGAYNGSGDGSNGADGTLTSAAAAGGTGAATGQGGGAGGSSASAPKVPTDLNGNANAGGGGGAVGYVWLRTRGAPANVSGPVVSPPAMNDTTL